MAEYTQEALNEFYHSAIIANANGDPAILSHETGHLRYEKGKGIVKTQEADCHLCVEQGLNDGRFHSVKEITMKLMMLIVIVIAAGVSTHAQSRVDISDCFVNPDFGRADRQGQNVLVRVPCSEAFAMLEARGLVSRATPQRPKRKRTSRRTRTRPTPQSQPDSRPCEERIRDNFLKFCSSGNCARHDVDIVTPADCHHLSDEKRLAAAKGDR